MCVARKRSGSIPALPPTTTVVSNGGAESSYSIDTITIARKTGDNFPEGGRSVVESFVVCPDCWGAVKAFFKTGPTTVETDY